jgi:hypothetical protein
MSTSYCHFAHIRLELICKNDSSRSRHCNPVQHNKCNFNSTIEGKSIMRKPKSWVRTIGTFSKLDIPIMVSVLASKNGQLMRML